jgi:hypothetical protein
MSLSFSTNLTLTINYQRAKGDAGAAAILNETVQRPVLLVDGTADDQADLFYRSPSSGLSLAAGATLNLDLSGITDDALGDDIALARVKTLFVRNLSLLTTGPVVRVGAAAANAWQGPLSVGGYVDVPPFGDQLWRHPKAGWVVTPGTVDILRLLNLDGVNAALLELFIAGASV